MKAKRYFIQFPEDMLQLQAGQSYSIGREKQNDIRLTDMSVSRRHALLFWEKGEFVIEDCRSTNGVFLNSRKVSRHALRDNDTIEVGRTLLKYKELDYGARQQVVPDMCDTMLLEAEIAAIAREMDDPHLCEKIHKLKHFIHRKRAEMASLAYRDDLTKLYNRRYFEEKIREEFARVRRSKRALSLIMADIDHFKNVNDTYGHQKGDQVLRAVGKLLSSLLRASDIPARYGGEELVIILPETNLSNGMILAEKIRHAVQERSKVLTGIGITLSLGVAFARPEYTSASMIISAADRALYRAKEGGRNRAEAET